MARTRTILPLVNRPAVLPPMEEIERTPGVLTGQRHSVQLSNQVQALALPTGPLSSHHQGVIALRLPKEGRVYALPRRFLHLDGLVSLEPTRKTMEMNALGAALFSRPSGIIDVALSPDGTGEVATATSDGISVWLNGKTPPVSSTQIIGGTFAIGWAGDGSFLMAGNQSNLAFWPGASTRVRAAIHYAMRSIPLGVGHIRHILPLPEHPSAFVAGSQGVAQITFRQGLREGHHRLKDTEGLGFEGLALGGGHLYALSSKGELLVWRLGPEGALGHPLVLSRGFKDPKALAATDDILMVRDSRGLHIYRANPFHGLALLEAPRIDGADRILGLVTTPALGVLLCLESPTQLDLLGFDYESSGPAPGHTPVESLPWEQVEVEPEAPESEADTPAAPPSASSPAPQEEAPIDEPPGAPKGLRRRGGKRHGLPTLSNFPGQEPSESARPAPPRRDSMAILRSVLGDQPAEVDALGFKPYVDALAAFLQDDQTRGPLTLSIEGPWGSGKSSFLLQLKKALKPDPTSNHIHTVTFNAWRHEKAESLWASFALTLMDQLRPKGLFPRSWANLKLTWKRIRGGRTSRVQFAIGVLALLSALGLWLFGVSALLFEQSPWVKSILSGLIGSDGKAAVEVFAKGGGLLGLTALAVHFSRWAFKELIDPLRGRLSEMVSAPDYEAHVPFIDTFHKDVADILTAYVGADRVYVLVEDLDRCTPPRSADLIEALNQMLGENGQVIFILAMDRQTVASAMAVKHKEIVPFLSPSLGEDADAKRAAYLRYGYRYVEKFIQLAFTLPMANTTAVRGLWTVDEATPQGTQRISPTTQSALLAAQAAHQAHPAPGSTPKPAAEDISDPRQGQSARAESARQKAEPDTPPGGSQSSHADSSKTVTPPDSSGRKTSDGAAPSPALQRLKVELAPDSHHLGRYFELVEFAIGDNPRRIKRWVNLFRLRVFLHGELGQLRPGAPDRANDLTLEKLAKLVAIEVRWPLLLEEARTNPYLLIELLEQREDTSPQALRWRRQEGFLALLHSGPMLNHEMQALSADEQDALYSLKNLSLDLVLRLVPPRAPVGDDPTPPPKDPL